MQLPKTDAHNSLTFLYYYGVYLIARLLADLEVAPLAAWIEAAQSRLDAAWKGTRVAETGQTMARAALDDADFRMSREVRLFEIHLLAAVRRNRDAADYRLFFPDGLRPFGRTGIDRRLRMVAALVRHLTSGSGPADPGAWAARLEERRKETAAALDVYRRACDAHTDARAEERRARDGWIEACRTAYGELIRRFPSDRERVESYFRKPESHRRAEPEAEAAAPAPGSAVKEVA